MVGEARRDRRQARGPRLRVAAAAAAATLAMGCAFAAEPPGGPPRTTPPRVLRVAPESGAVLTTPPRQVEIDFDEVVAEQITGTTRDITGAVLLSPVAGKYSVDWHHSHLTVEPKGGFLPGRIYRVELLPVIVDLRQNRLRQGKVVVFSTGPDIPTATLSGTIVDWVGNRVAAGALVEAVLLPDSLPYRALADSGGNFTMGAMPAGDYLVYGVVDQNGNRRRDPREAFDTARVSLQDSARVGLYAFTHDTVGPRLRSVEIADSVTLRLVFDRPLDPTQTTDTSMVHVAPAADSTQTLKVTNVYTPAAFDSANKAAAAAAAARDTTRRRQAAAPAQPPAAPAGPRQAGRRPGAPGPAGPRADTARAMHLLAVRPAPTDRRMIRLAAPLTPSSRYLVTVAGVRGLTAVVGPVSHASMTAPKPPPPRNPAKPDTSAAHRDTTAAHRDSTAAHRDTTPPAAPPGSQPPRPDSTPAPRSDSLPARRDSNPPPLPPSPAPAPPR